MSSPPPSYSFPNPNDSTHEQPRSTPSGRDASQNKDNRRSTRHGGSPNLELPYRPSQQGCMDERSPLLSYPDGPVATPSYNMPQTPTRPKIAIPKRSNYAPQNGQGRKSSFLSLFPSPSTLKKLSSANPWQKYQTEDDERLWYDQFTSVDWIRDTVADSFRFKHFNGKLDFRGRIEAWFEAAQGWLVVAIIGFTTASIAYCIVKSENAIFDLKFGYCGQGRFLSRSQCCGQKEMQDCEQWTTWSQVLRGTTQATQSIDFLAYITWMLLLASLSCLFTLATRLVTPSTKLKASEQEVISENMPTAEAYHPPKVMYSAAGSGVAEVRVILSGFVLRGFLGARTLIMKTFGLILSASSGLSIGKEGPLVHIATCVGNVVGRRFPKYATNEGKLRELLSAAASSGIALAFGAPVGGVIFSLEEVSYFFPPQTLFRTFFCSLTAALSLRLFNPYGTGKIVLFQVHYEKEWNYLGMIMFMILGILGGTIGALFIKASKLWARTFRRIPFIKNSPLIEVVVIALISGLTSYWNHYTTMPITELLLQLFSPCNNTAELGTSLCPTKAQIPVLISQLIIAFLIKAVLTTLAFGIKVPAGIYVPSMVVGGLLGRIVGHLVQYLAVTYPHSVVFSRCSAFDSHLEDCAVPGTYALLAAGATMCGVTRLTLTLAVILFELTGSLDYVLPFSVTIFVAKWTADAIEPLSIYDVLTQANSYPFLQHKTRPHLTGTLLDVAHPPSENRVIETSHASPHPIPRTTLRRKLNYLHSHDGALPILKEDAVLVGLIACSDLQFALDQMEGAEQSVCLIPPHAAVAAGVGAGATTVGRQWAAGNASEAHADLGPFIDYAPFTLDAASPLELVYECFSRLGLRYICALSEGKYVGLLHKKAFVQFLVEQQKDA